MPKRFAATEAAAEKGLENTSPKSGAKLVGEWAAERMGLTPEETDAYAKSVVQADFEEAGDEDVIRKLAGDLTAAQVEISDAEIRAALNDKAVEARRQFMDKQG